MYRNTRTLVWMVLIFMGIAIPMGYYVFNKPIHCVVSLIVGIAAWIGWAILSSWLFGLGRFASAHMKSQLEKLTFVSKSVGDSRLADYTRSMEHLSETQESSKRYGVPAYQSLGMLKTSNLAIEPIDWQTIEATDGELVNVPQNPAYLLNYKGKPFVAKILHATNTHEYLHEESMGTGVSGALELFARSLEDANAITRWLNTQASEHSIYRGKMLLVASPNDGTVGQTVRIQSRPEQDRDEIILPDEIISIAERLVLSNSKHRERLAKVGHASNLGLLLHGPPGTGKTLVTRYLIDCCKNHTVIVPTDMSVETLRESFRLGNYLQPAILVLEDVDLLAQDRTTASSVDGLQELMNQMDGLAPASDVTVMMSTNRPEVLEPALAARPGRVSQTIEFPLPDAAARERLFGLFFKGVKTEWLALGPWVQRTDGASPAFIQELCRRSMLICAERSDIPADDESTEWEIGAEDLDQAIHDLVVVGGKLTASSLGFPSEAKGRSGFH